MTDITVHTADPRDPDAAPLLQASHALMQSLFPPGSCHYLSIDKLCAPSVHFYVARKSGASIGCGALSIQRGYGEIKSMFTTKPSRGQGVAAALLDHIQHAARGHGLPLLRLETGDSLTAAHKLYTRHGFSFCEPFGGYTAHPHSLFMEKKL